ncbi:2562_t:CDS:1, partial [Racocetra fulgida]
REYKESSRKRMIQFDCHRKLDINIDIAVKKAKIKFSYDIYHKKLVDVATPKEIKYEIIQNLYMDPI